MRKKRHQCQDDNLKDFYLGVDGGSNQNFYLTRLKGSIIVNQDQEKSSL